MSFAAKKDKMPSNPQKTLEERLAAKEITREEYEYARIEANYRFVEVPNWVLNDQFRFVPPNTVIGSSSNSTTESKANKDVVKLVVVGISKLLSPRNIK